MARGHATINRRIVMRHPWSPPWWTTTIWGRSLSIGRAERKSVQVQSGFRVLFIPAFDTPGQAIDGAALVRRTTGLGIDGRQWTDVSPNWIGRLRLIWSFVWGGRRIEGNWGAL
jgi:hypothetical protein